MIFCVLAPPISPHRCVCVCVCMCVCVCACVCVCVCRCVRSYVCVRTYMFVRAYIIMCLYDFHYNALSPRPTDLPPQMYMRVRGYECTHMGVYARPYVCVRGHSFVLPSRARSAGMSGWGLGSRPKKMYGERLGDGVEYHLMSPTPRR